jgi:transcriptional regulator with XRE-family HTH domain
MSMAARLRQARVRKAFSLQAAADKLSISKAHLWDLEMGKSDNPTRELLNKCSDAYGVTVAWIIGEQAEEEADDQLKVMFRQLRDLDPADRDLIQTLIEKRQQQKT